MYIFPDMIDLGLHKGQSFPTEDHRKVAQALALCNRNIHSRDRLTEVVQEIVAVPTDKIRTVTIDDLPIAKSYVLN